MKFIFTKKKDKRSENETSMACHMLSFDKRFDKLFAGFTLNQRQELLNFYDQ